MYASTLCESATRVSMERKPKRRTRERIVDIIQNEPLGRIYVKTPDARAVAYE